MRESLCTAINEEEDLQVAETNLQENSPIQLALPNGYDMLFLTREPDIILLALGNPGHDDLLALKLLKKRFPHAPVFAFITNEVPGQGKSALQYGADTVLSKSLSRDELIKALRSARSKAVFLSG